MRKVLLPKYQYWIVNCWVFDWPKCNA